MAEDIGLYHRLVGGEPLHASPTEHQATPASTRLEFNTMHGNFDPGWMQYRKTLMNESL